MTTWLAPRHGGLEATPRKGPVKPDRPGGLSCLPDLFVFFDFAVADVDDAVGVHGDIVLVGHQHDGVALLVQPLEQAP